MATLPNLDSFALVVSGIRRCGKSTLLFQLLREKHPDALYLNFDQTDSITKNGKIIHVVPACDYLLS